MRDSTVYDKLITHLLDSLDSAYEKALLVGFNENILQLFSLLAYAIKNDISKNYDMYRDNSE